MIDSLCFVGVRTEVIKAYNVRPPDLHLIAQLFLPGPLVHLFDIHIVIQMAGFLISYALAGSEAWADLLNFRLGDLLCG